jgi:uncharacterized membrane protein YeaQ/YmgE (transglycosylase-associated protein family)
MRTIWSRVRSYAGIGWRQQTPARHWATVTRCRNPKNWKGDTMSIIWAIVIGLLVGIVAKFLMPGRQGGGIIVTALLGIVGAVVATFLGQAMGIYAAGQSAGFIASVIGAVVVLLLYGLVTRNRRTVL